MRKLRIFRKDKYRKGRAKRKGSQKEIRLKSSDRNDAVLDGILKQLSTGLEIQFPHYFIFVKLDCSGRDTENVADLLGRVPFSQQLQDLPLPGRQLSNGIVSKMEALLIRLHKFPGNYGCHISPSFYGLTNGCNQLIGCGMLQ
jgi:hypothetical protein